MPEPVTAPENTNPAEQGATPQEQSPPASVARKEEAKPDAPGATPEGLGDAGKAAIQKERDARADLERRLAESEQLKKDLAAQVKAFEDRDKTEQQKLADRVEELQQAIAAKDKEIDRAQRASLRASVAADKGVPVTSVSGTTREEMEASADEVLAWLEAKTASKRSTPKPPAPSGGLKSGASSTGDQSTDPKERAAAALRAMRSGI
jgi:hypothetical protein